MAANHHQPASAYLGINPGKFFLGILILVIGLSYLGQSLGWLSINIGYVFWHFWSIFLIFIGLSMLDRHNRQTVYFGLAVAVIILLVLFYTVAEKPFFDQVNKTEKIEVPRETGVKQAKINVYSQAMALKVEGGAAKLVEGNFQSQFVSLTSTVAVKDGVEEISFDTRDYDSRLGWSYFGKNISNFFLKITPDLPVDLLISSAASDINLDLRTVKARHLNINSGASNIILALGPNATTSEVNINAKASSVTIRLPEAMGVRLKFNSDLSARNLPRLSALGNNIFESSNYNLALNKVAINLNSNISNIDLIWSR
ncbi:MAG: hypothetical protein AAB645_02490 [Patescibacteria group bacterium]